VRGRVKPIGKHPVNLTDYMYLDKLSLRVLLVCYHMFG